MSATNKEIAAVAIVACLIVVLWPHSKSPQVGDAAAVKVESASAIRDDIEGKSYTEKVKIKSEAIEKKKFEIIQTYHDDEYGLDIQITNVATTTDGIIVFAKAWNDKGKQLGFGADGTVETERFIIHNPPVLVPDGTTRLIQIDGRDVVKDNYKEDVVEATKRSLAHTIHIVGRSDTVIVPGKIGNTTSTFFPDAGDPASAAVDGRTYRNGVNETIGTIRAGNGTGADATAATVAAVRLQGSVTTNQWQTLIRGQFHFNTAAIPDTDVISSATFSLDYNSDTDTLTGETSANSAIVVVQGAAASNTTLAASDFQTTGTTDFGRSGTQSSLGAAYNDITLNASGIAAISKTGVTKFATKYGWDIDNTITGLTWASAGVQDILVEAADTAGTTADPKLVVVHAAAAAPSAGEEYMIVF